MIDSPGEKGKGNTPREAATPAPTRVSQFERTAKVGIGRNGNERASRTLEIAYDVHRNYFPTKTYRTL